MCKKKWLWGVRTISLQAKALAGASILRTLIIHPPIISTLTILELMVSTRLVSTHLVSTLTIPTLTILKLVISTLTIAWALGLGARAPKPGAICEPPGAPHLNGGDGGLWLNCSRQHCARSPPLPPI